MSNSRIELASNVCSLTVNEKIELLSAVGPSSDVVEQQLTDILLQLIINPADSADRAVFTSKLMDICQRRSLQRNVQNFHSYGPQSVTLQEPRVNERPSTSQATGPCQFHNQSMFASEQLTSPYMYLSQLFPTLFPPACFRSPNPQFSFSSPFQPDGIIRNLMLRPQLPNYIANLTPIPPAILLSNMFSTIPILREAEFKTNPFYQNKIKLMLPTRLRPTNELTMPQNVSCRRQHFRECTFAFSLTTDNCSIISQSLMESDLNELNIGRHHIVIRMGKYNENSEFYKQVMPLNLQIRVNENYVQLPPLRHYDFQYRHVCKYVVITDEIQLTPGATNSVVINWVPETDKIFDFDICVGRIVPYHILFCHILITNYIKLDVSFLRVIDLIKHETEQDGVGRRTVRFSLCCPLSGQRMTYPGIGKFCRHLKMFDVENYIQMNETYNSWKCPICQQYTQLRDLEILGYIGLNVIRSNRLPDNCNEIEFNVDGAWIAIVSGMQQNPTADNNEFSTDNENSTIENIGFSNDNENSTMENIEFSNDNENSTTEDIERSDDSEMSIEENNAFPDDSEMSRRENNTFCDEDKTPTGDNNRFSDDDENPTADDNGLSDENTEFRNTANVEFTTSGISNNNYFHLESEILNNNVESAPIIIDVINLTGDE